MKNKLLEAIKSKPITFREAKKKLSLENSQNKELDRNLRELVAEDKIYYKKRTETYHEKDNREIIGTFHETKQEFGFVEMESGDSIFIPGQFVLNAIHGDTVKVSILPSRGDGKGDAGKIKRVMKRNGSNIVGTVFKDEDLLKIEVSDTSSKHDYIITNPNGIKEGDVVVSKFVDFKDFKIEVKVIENMGPQMAQIDWEVVVKRAGLEKDFEKSVLDAANQVDETIDSKRKDLTDRLIVTIDGEYSKDLDDAIDVELLKDGNWRLGVHIADVSHYVKEDSIIDHEAYKRGTSVYLIDKVVPMLPTRLSNDLCSLNPNTKKLALSVDMIVNPAGEVIKTDIYESIIESKYRLTYKEVAKLLDGEVDIVNDDVELTEMLKEAHRLASVSRKVKVEKGMIDFELPELSFTLKENGEPEKLSISYQTVSEKLIEDLMVLTNESVAVFLDENEVPALFRIHPKPQAENIDKFKETIRFFGYQIDKPTEKVSNKDFMALIGQLKDDHTATIIKRMLVQTMEKAIYSSTDLGHFGQGLKNYLHFTSPIRRYPDLIVHRTIKDFLINKTKTSPNSESRISYLNEAAKHTSERERNAMQAERKLMDIKKTRLMKDEIGTNKDGQIVSVTNFGLFIELENFTQGLFRFESVKPEELINHGGQKATFKVAGKQYEYRLGQTVNVNILNLDIPKGLMDFKINESN